MEASDPDANDEDVECVSSANHRDARPVIIAIRDSPKEMLSRQLGKNEVLAEKNRGRKRCYLSEDPAADPPQEIIDIDDDADLFSWDHQGYRCTAVTDDRRSRAAAVVRLEDLKPVRELTDVDFEAIATMRQQNKRDALRMYTLKYLPHFVPLHDLAGWGEEGQGFDYQGQFETEPKANHGKASGGGAGGRRATQERQYGTAKAYTQPKKRVKSKRGSTRRRGSKFKRKFSKKA